MDQTYSERDEKCKFILSNECRFFVTHRVTIKLTFENCGIGLKNGRKEKYTHKLFVVHIIYLMYTNCK